MVFLFRPCFIEPPGLPADFYSLNNIHCGKAVPRWAGPTREKEEKDPLCLWSQAFAFEFNPATIYVPHDDPCFRAAGEDLLGIKEDPALFGGPPAKDAQGRLSMDLYAYVSFKLKEDDSLLPDIFGRRLQFGSSAGKERTEAYVRVDMEKGKTLNPELQPANVDKNAATCTAAVGGVGTVAGFLGGDPILMMQNVQNMVGSGQVGVPVNPGMRDFMSKFSWANFAFLTPPPEFLTSLLIPDENRGPSAKRRLSDAAAASGAESDEEEKPPSDLPDLDETGNAAFLRKAGASADEYFIGIIMGVLLTPVSTTPQRSCCAHM
jgi:hypothetical protein